MDTITSLMTVDYANWLITLVVILVGIASVGELIGKVSIVIGKPVKWVKQNDNDHEQIEKLIKSQQETEKQIQDISTKMDKLNEVLIDTKIDSLRWDILDFASALSGNRTYGLEQFAHVFRCYDKYEKILEENGLTNGQVTQSMELIKKKYQEILENQN